MIQLLKGGSTLSGIERARPLRKVKVKIADVSESHGVGRVRLTMLGTQDLGKSSTCYNSRGNTS
jgi:hypothetical protein